MATSSASRPLVEWAQSRNDLFLKFPVRKIDAATMKSKVNEVGDTLTVSFSASSAGEPIRYALELNLFEIVVTDSLQVQHKASGLYITLLKHVQGVWPRLTRAKEKDPRIKIDWDKWEDLDSESDSEEPTPGQLPTPQELAEAYPGLQPPSSSTLIEGKNKKNGGRTLTLKDKWLALFSLILLVLWFGCGMRFLFLVGRALSVQKLSLIFKEGYHILSGPCLVAQGLGLLEPIHALFKISKGNWFPAFLLHTGRDICLFLLVMHGANAAQDWGAVLMIVVWTVGEVIRYSFYFLTITNGTAPDPVTWARYTIPLYLLPIGFTTEMRVLWMAKDELTETQQSFLFGYTLLAYVLGAPFVWMSVYKLRTKKLGSDAKKKIKTK